MAHRPDTENLERIAVLKSQLRYFEAERRATREQMVLSTSSRPRLRLMPGWVAYVYDGLDVRQSSDNDLGRFVLDEQSFHLKAHRYHGISDSGQVVYRLSGVYRANKTGRHQFGIQMQYQGELGSNSPKCVARLSVDGKTLLEDSAVFTSHEKHQAQMLGWAELKKGLHSTEVWLSCLSPVVTQYKVRSARNRVLPEVMFSIQSRSPGETSLAAHKQRFWHRSMMRKTQL